MTIPAPTRHRAGKRVPVWPPPLPPHSLSCLGGDPLEKAPRQAGIGSEHLSVGLGRGSKCSESFGGLVLLRCDQALCRAEHCEFWIEPVGDRKILRGRVEFSELRIKDSP